MQGTFIFSWLIQGDIAMLLRRRARFKCRLPCYRRLALLVGVLSFSIMTYAAEPHELVPTVKRWQAFPGVLDLSKCRIGDHAELLASEAAVLTEFLLDRSISIGPSGTLLRLQLGNLELPTMQSVYGDDIRDQAYSLRIDSSGVTIRGRTPVGVLYGIQTLKQLISDTYTAPHVDIMDWPELAYRGVMVDPARANENADYYYRLVEFCGRYKLNRIHLHLTDDQSVTLHHERYLSLMHPHSWKADSLRRLVQHARRLRIELIPEIESLGHARVFLRHPDFGEFLHQTDKNKPPGSWVGTTQPGYTNVLCPASERVSAYLTDMYALAASIFPYPVIHLGCDEVDMSKCSRCAAKFPGISPTKWFRQHLQHCRALAARHDRQVAVWGDMLLKQPQILDGLSPDGFVIYDWHYRPEVSEKSVMLFKEKGFEVIGCPALMCHPHMILPSKRNYANIRRFAEIARKHELRGLDTTVWIPTRYLSDALWTGIAYAAAQSWSGGRCENVVFYNAFACDFFGLPRGDAFATAYSEIGAVDWNLNRFRLSCWFDDDSLAKAKREATGELKSEAGQYLARLRSAAGVMANLREGVTENRIAWEVMLPVLIARSHRVYDQVTRRGLGDEKCYPGNGVWRSVAPSASLRR